MNKEYKKYGDERETTQNKKKQKTKRKQIKYNENSPPKTKRKGNEKKKRGTMEGIFKNHVTFDLT